MDLRAEILTDHSRLVIDRVIGYVGNSTEKFAELMKLLFTTENIVPQRAAWAVSNVLEKYPEMIEPYLESIIELMQGTDIDAVRRNILRVLQFVEIPEQLCGTVYDVCSHFLLSASESIAVRVFSITIIVNIAKRFPDLKYETGLVINSAIQEEASPALISRAKHELKKLSIMQ